MAGEYEPPRINWLFVLAVVLGIAGLVVWIR